MKTLTTLAAAEKVKGGVQVVWLVEIDADSPDAAPVTLYYGSRQYTLTSKTYLDFLTQRGLRLSWDRIRHGGGLASVATAQVTIRNETGESNLTDSYFFENDEVRIYLGFVTGAEQKTDAVQVSTSFIEETPFNVTDWIINTIDGSDKDFSAIPRDIVNLTEHPDAPYDEYGKPLPWVVGALNVGPHDDAGAFSFLAPCRQLDGFLREFTAGKRCDIYGAPFQYYEQAKRYGEIPAASYTQTGSTFTVDKARRVMRLYPVLPSGTNDVTNYQKVFDGDASTSVTVLSGSNLDVQIGGVPKLGTLISALVQINAGGGAFGYDVLYNGSSIFANASATGDTTISLTNASTDHANDWDFELYEVRIDGSGASPTLEQVYLEITYDDQMTADRQALSVHQKVTGWEDVSGNYADGAIVAGSSGAALTNPAHVLAAALRGKALMGLAAAEVDAAAVATAATARVGWNFAFSETNIVDDIEWLNRFCFTAGLHLFKSFEGKWKMVAMDKGRTPQHAFIGDQHIAVKNPDAPVSAWLPDLSFAKTPTRDIINEVVLKHRRDRGTGEYTALYMASGRHRITGTCSTSEAGTLTDSSATFMTSGVVVGESVYVVGDKTYTVASSPVSETVLSITAAVGGVRNNAAGTTYFAGPSLSGDLKRSQLRYKTTNPLGEETKDFRKLGGFSSDLIADRATAELFVQHLVDWRSQRRLIIEFSTFMNAIDVELGDACFFDHEWLPALRRPLQLGTLTDSETSASTGFSSATNTLFRVGDYILVDDKEAVLVTAVAYATGGMTVTRAQCNTQAIAHSAGASLKRLNLVKWEITGIQILVDQSQIRLELQEMPPSYLPVGRVVASGYPSYNTATASQRAQAGWATLNSGRVEENDTYSAISYVGPDTGTY